MNVLEFEFWITLKWSQLRQSEKAEAKLVIEHVYGRSHCIHPSKLARQLDTSSMVCLTSKIEHTSFQQMQY